jgi:hypothetical protein
VTESAAPRLAQLLKDHVVTMRQRVDRGDDPGLPIESEALDAIFRNYEKIQTTVETMSSGIVVTQTSRHRAIGHKLYWRWAPTTVTTRSARLSSHA